MTSLPVNACWQRFGAVAPFIFSSKSPVSTACVKRRPLRICQPQLPPLRRPKPRGSRGVSPPDTSPSNPKSMAWSVGSVSRPSPTWRDEAVRSPRRLCSNSWRDWSPTDPPAQRRPETKRRSSASSRPALASVRYPEPGERRGADMHDITLVTRRDSKSVRCVQWAVCCTASCLASHAGAMTGAPAIQCTFVQVGNGEWNERE